MTETSITIERQLSQLTETVAETDLWRAIAATLAAGQSASLDGVWGSAAALAATVLAHEQADSGLLIVTPHANELDDWADELVLFGSAQPVVFPSWEGADREEAFRDPSAGQRLRVLHQLAQQRLTTPLVTSVQAMLQPVPSPDQFRDAQRLLRVGDRLDVTPLLSMAGREPVPPHDRRGIAGRILTAWWHSGSVLDRLAAPGAN